MALVYHFNLKSLVNSIEDLTKNKKIFKINYYYLYDKELDKFFIKILDEFISALKNEEKKFYVVFNSVNPDILYPKSENAKKLKNLLLNEKLEILKNFLKSKEISYFDFNQYIINKYNEDNISKIFKRINGHWDHYTEQGFYEITKQIHLNLF